MSAEHRTGKGEEVLASTVGANLAQGCEGEDSIPSAAAAGVRRGNVPRQPRGYTVGTLACPALAASDTPSATCPAGVADRRTNRWRAWG